MFGFCSESIKECPWLWIAQTTIPKENMSASGDMELYIWASGAIKSKSGWASTGTFTEHPVNFGVIYKEDVS